MICQHCGEEFEGRYNAKWCPDCRPVVAAEQQRERRRQRAASGISLAREVPTEKQCCYCGQIKPAGDFNAAKDRPDGLQSTCRACRTERAREARKAKKWKSCEPKIPKIPEAKGLQCKVCGAELTGQSKNACSNDECRKEWVRRYSRGLNAGRKPLKERKCKECGNKFVPEYGNKRRSFCSDRCSRVYGRRIAKATRKARIRGADRVDAVDPRYILERDHWRCYLCGTKTPRRFRGTYERNAPEIDHVVPLALGGSHTEDNLRCICRSCNQAKSDRSLDEVTITVNVQLRLM